MPMQTNDLVVKLGGDDLSLYYGLSRFSRILLETWMQSRQSKVALVGQTIGPFPRALEPIVRRVLDGTYIQTRDGRNASYLRDVVKLRHVRSSYDIAFLDLPRQSLAATSDTFTRYGLAPKSYITIVPSGLSSAYTCKRDDYIDNYVRIVRGVLSLLTGGETKVVLLPHVSHTDKNDDSEMIADITRCLSATERMRIVIIQDDEPAEILRHILGSGIATIAGRMHAAVSSFQMGTPAICLSYSVKYGGVLGDSLEVPDLIVECKGLEHWSNHEVADAVLSRVDSVVSNATALRSRIISRVRAIQGSLKESLDETFPIAPAVAEGDRSS